MAFARRNQQNKAPSTGTVAPATQPQAQVFRPAILPEDASYLGFIFDPEHFPFTLLQKLTVIAQKIRELGLEKTGGKKKDSDLKYDYFEEAEIAKHLVALLVSEKIGYAAGTPHITNRFTGTTYKGVSFTSMHVRSAAIFSHAESKEWIIIPGVGEARDYGDKAVTKAITSAIKYIWMKTFLISEGNDIELDQGQDDERPRQQPKQSDTQTRKPVARKGLKVSCEKCKGEIREGTKFRGQPVAAAFFAQETKKAFGQALCGDCASAAVEERKKKEPETKAAPKQSSAKAGDPLDTVLISATPRQITAKGEKKTIYDLTLHGGLKITDWHESHYDLYEQTEEGTTYQIKVVFDEKQNGRYVNRNLVALMEFDGECYEDENGEDISPEGGEEGGDLQQEFDNSFGASDDDTPFTP